MITVNEMYRRLEELDYLTSEFDNRELINEYNWILQSLKGSES